MNPDGYNYPIDDPTLTSTTIPGIVNETEKFHMVMTFGFWAYLLTNICGNFSPEMPATMVPAGCTGLIVLAQTITLMVIRFSHGGKVCSGAYGVNSRYSDYYM